MQIRKIIHIGGVLIPVISDEIGKSQTIALVLSGFVIFLIIEAFKQKIPEAVLSLVYRENELKGFSIEPLSYFISVLSLLYLSFFIDEKICFAAIAILAAGDGFAGVIGRRYGRHRFSFNKNKSWEGTLSGFVAASLTGFYFAGGIALVGSAFGMLAGAVNRNDNIAVPYAALAAMFLARYATIWI
ncbi:MAG: diacylglycerol/polyprenol kinase family protein [Candidatus Methanoperedens sp.]